MATRGHASSGKYLLLAVLLVFLTLPHATKELSFGFGGDDNAAGGAQKQVVTKQQQRPVERKFKFHKIERAYIEEKDDEAADDDDDDNENDKNSGGNSHSAAQVDSQEAVSKRQTEKLQVDDDDDPDSDYQFARVRKAHKEHGQPKQTSKEQPEAASSSFISSLFGGFFGSAEVDKEEQSEERVMVESKTNGIIDWLKWLTDKADKTDKVAPETIPTDGESLLSYFNRWPFNSLFPIGKPVKPISMPRRSAAPPNGSGTSSAAAESAEQAATPMSQDYFESLLHTLPSFVASATHVRDTECRQQLQIFQRQLRGHKLWTLQMLDATGKVPAGLLRGNINQFGDFDLCTQVKTVVKVTPETPMRIRGKYCLAHIETQAAVPELKLPVHLAHGRGLWNGHLGNPSHFVPRYAVANWGICIPHLCSSAVVQELFETSLRPYNNTGVEFHVEVNEQDCYVRQSKRFTKLLKKDGKFGLTILSIGCLALSMTMALIYEYWHVLSAILKGRLKMTTAATDEETVTAEPAAELELTESGETESPADTNAEALEATEMATNAAPTQLPLKQLLLELFLAFSPRRTLAHLLSGSAQSHMEYPILHVLKLAATLMLYICLKYLMIGHLPISNRDKLVRAMDQPLSVLFRAPLIYADTLLLISGFLSAQQLSQEMAQKSHIQLLKRLSAKVARYLPTMYVVLLVQTWILPHLGAAPLWSNLIGQNAQLCSQQMWRNVFSSQNAIDFEETCSPVTIQYGLEVQLFLLGPLIVWLYYTNSDAGFLVYGAIHALSVGARYSRTNREHLSMTLFHGMNVSKFYRTANILYSSPISRATPYLLGIGAGLLQHSQAGSLDVAAEFMPIGWLLSLLSVLWCFWSPSAGMRSDFVYSSSDAAAYAAWSPLLLGLALCWIILMFPRGENSVLSFLTGTRPVLFLSRICFPVQMVMFAVILYHTASVKETIKYQVTDLINFNEIGLILLLATALAFLIDVPSQKIRNLLVNRIFAERPQQDAEQEPLSGAEPSEAEASEDRSEAVTSDTPEPPDNIWASDAEEEEHQYIQRPRRSTNAEAVANTSEQQEEVIQKQTAEDMQEEPKVVQGDVDEEIEEEEEDDESEIAEEDEVKKRPETPPPAKVEVEVPTYRRRRRPISDD